MTSTIPSTEMTALGQSPPGADPPQQTSASQNHLTDARDEARRALDVVRHELLVERNDQGHWEGELAASALSTATAISAFAAVLLSDQTAKTTTDQHNDLPHLISRGIAYLQQQQNDDGGFGDTDRSHSNIATSYLAVAASTLAEKIGRPGLSEQSLKRLNAYIERAGKLDGLRRRYGKDKTFVVPIMNNLAIAGLISWDQVPALPFEAAVFPQSLYRFLSMPVVSYAIPALVAIGQARHLLGRKTWFPLRVIRNLSINPTLKVLRRMQPESGGYLEATPLTAFVVMSLAATGRTSLSVVQEGLKFLRDSMRDEGSWPIDTNLATWVTSLSMHALACDPEDDRSWCDEELIRWHLSCQHLKPHPFTGARPGGWGWTDLSGAVPDSDDTPAAILALLLSKPSCSAELKAEIDQATLLAGRWLLQLQNRNGGWPTFCRGWGKLPFDRSSTDLTAHAMRALQQLAPDASLRSHKAVQQGIRFLDRQQQTDGSWNPLWFGNQDRDDESNPIYGTAKVLLASQLPPAAQQLAAEFLIKNQNPDGGWGGGNSMVEKLARASENQAPDESSAHTLIPEGLISSVEETALAVDALATVILRLRDKSEQEYRSDVSAKGFETAERSRPPESNSLETSGFAWHPGDDSETQALLAAILSGVTFLVQSVDDRRHRISWPIGFYFAKLWYHERLYPSIFTAAALGKFLRCTAPQHDPEWPQ